MAPNIPLTLPLTILFFFLTQSTAIADSPLNGVLSAGQSVYSDVFASSTTNLGALVTDGASALSHVLPSSSGHATVDANSATASPTTSGSDASSRSPPTSLSSVGASASTNLPSTQEAAAPPSSTPISSPQASPSPPPNGHSNAHKTAAIIAVAVICVILSLALLILAICICLCRRRKHKSKTKASHSRVPPTDEEEEEVKSVSPDGGMVQHPHHTDAITHAHTQPHHQQAYHYNPIPAPEPQMRRSMHQRHSTLSEPATVDPFRDEQAPLPHHHYPQPHENPFVSPVEHRHPHEYPTVPRSHPSTSSSGFFDAPSSHSHPPSGTSSDRPVEHYNNSHNDTSPISPAVEVEGSPVWWRLPSAPFPPRRSSRRSRMGRTVHYPSMSETSDFDFGFAGEGGGPGRRGDGLGREAYSIRRKPVPEGNMVSRQSLAS